MKKSFWVVLVIIVIVLIIAGIASNKNSGPTSASKEPIKIGAALSLSGDAASWGEAEKNGINLAVDEINAQGGIDGHPISILNEDTKSSSVGSLSATQKLVNFDGVSYIIGPTWLDSYPGAQGVVKDKNVIMITPSASINAVQQGDPVKNVFSTWYRVDAITDGLAKAIKESGKTKIALVFQNDAYYTEFISFFKKAAQAGGLEIVSEDLINPGNSDFRTVFSKIKSKGANGMVFGMYDEKMTLGFLKQHKETASSLALFSNEVIRQYLDNKDYVPYLDGAVFVENAQLSKEFVDKYHAKYSVDPVFSASTAYDAVMIISKLIKEGSGLPIVTGAAEKSNNRVGNVISLLRGQMFNTVSFGYMTFDTLGGVTTDSKQYQIRTVVNGEIK